MSWRMLIFFPRIAKLTLFECDVFPPFHGFSNANIEDLVVNWEKGTIFCAEHTTMKWERGWIPPRGRSERGAKRRTNEGPEGGSTPSRTSSWCAKHKKLSPFPSELLNLQCEHWTVKQEGNRQTQRACVSLHGEKGLEYYQSNSGMTTRFIPM